MPDETTSTTRGPRALAPTRDHTEVPAGERGVPSRGAPSRPAVLLGVLPELALAAVAACLFVLARNFQYAPQPDQLGPGFWPQLLCAGIFVCALVRVAQKIRARAEPVPGATKEEVDHFLWRRLALALSLVVGYVLGTVFLGYILATTLFFVAFVWLGGQRRWYVAPLGFAVSLLFAFVFLKVVYVSLPSGVGIFDQISVLIYQLIGVY